MAAAELLISKARERGLRHFFGIPGGGIPLNLLANGQKQGVDFINVSHESSAAIMAAYYGFFKGTAGLALGVRGVGAGNMVGGITNVHFERFPVVAVCETCPGHQAEYDLVQHCDHQQLFWGLAKYQAQLTAENASDAIDEAFFQAADGRPGPAFLDFPADLDAVAPANPPRTFETMAPEPDEDSLAVLRQALSQSRRPLILAGADIAREGACQELLKLVENIQAAVLVTMEARGVFPEHHPRWAGVFVGVFDPSFMESLLLAKADLVLTVGVDSLMTHTPWAADLPTCEIAARKKYHNLTPAPLARVSGDLRNLLQRLTESAPQEGFPAESVRRLRQEILKDHQRPADARLAVQDILQITRQLLPSDGILFSETGVFIRILEQLWLVDEPGKYFGTSGGRTMGLLLPAILGARLADPDANMVGVGADGSLLMRLGELEVFARTGAAVPLIIINDQALGTMKARQKARGFPDYALDLHPVDFAAVARSFGLNGVTVETPESFEKALRQALQAECTTLIDARVDAQIYQDSF